MMKAFTISPDTNAKFPALNAMKLVPEKLSQSSFSILVIESLVNEVTNINTRVYNEVRGENWKDEIRVAATNCYRLAEKMLYQEKVEKVIIMETMPRFDSFSSDPMSVK